MTGVAVGDARLVIVTRPVDQADAWASGLRQHGVSARAVPLIGIDEAADPAAVDAAWAGLARYALLVFVSPNAAARFFARRPAGHVWPDDVRLASPGPGTSEVLRALGVPAAQLIEPAADAAQFDSEALWVQLGRLGWQGTRVLIVRGEGGRGWLADQLQAAGAEVDFLSAYQRGPADLSPADREALQQALAAPAAHLWLFSSSEAVDHLLGAGLKAAAPLRQALQKSSAITTHSRIGERARAAGFGTVLACRPEMAAVVACIQSLGSPQPCGAPPSAL